MIIESKQHLKHLEQIKKNQLYKRWLYGWDHPPDLDDSKNKKLTNYLRG